ncbi:hypothetical protein K4G96_23765, partial [Mycobacterium tuberculosis]|nr:hypothetical protein [Mycobacterium tuberculosis]
TDRTVSVIAGNSAVYDSRADAFRAAFGVALADALNKLVAAGKLKTNPMKGMVAAVSVGIVNGEAICDLEYIEDSAAETDMNVVMTEDGRII